MERKTHMDLFGAVSLIGFALVLAFNQVVIKVTVGGFSPIFAAGLRSVIGMICLALWMHWRGIDVRRGRRIAFPGFLAGILFSVEFMLLFSALDITSVSRASIIFYSMPVWLALAAHFLLPGERITGARIAGLVLAMAGVALALADRQSGAANLWGDLAALGGALCWAGIALVVRVTPLSEVEPELQLAWQLVVSGILMTVMAPLFGPVLRDVQPVHIAGLLFSAVGVVFVGFLFWFWLMKIYPAASVASFSFLSPVFSVLLGWWLLDESTGPAIWGALALVAAGLFLINRR